MKLSIINEVREGPLGRFNLPISRAQQSLVKEGIFDVVHQHLNEGVLNLC